MDLRQLRYFVAVAEELHFGRAAERLHMAQPPLSQAIRALEKDLGTPLLTRTTRRVDLTAAGAAYLEHARSILESVERAAQEARLVAAGTLGHLTVGCVGSATYSLLPRLARHLRRALPEVELDFRGEMLVPDQVAALDTGAIDLALLRPPVADPGLTVTPLRRDRLVVALPADHPLAERRRVRVADLGGQDLIAHSADRRSTMYDVVQRLGQETGTALRIRHEVGETSTLVTLVAGGLGVAVVPEPTTALALDGVRYVPLVAPVRRVELAAAHRSGRDEPHVARALSVVEQLVRAPRA